ncbi:MAG: Holliday junction resolvase RuvX [Fuerstiella sp.]|nr:Holliday junction resolvase RuvX [Fuerstiella sp.]
MNNQRPDLLPQQHTANVPQKGRLLGIDYGTVRVGISVCDENQQLASPLHNYQRVSRQADQQFFRKQVKEYKIAGFVVGLPLHMKGDESRISSEARRYGQWLNSVTRLPVTFQDERLSSVQADVLLSATELTKKQRKARIDKLAAQILLQNWLDGRQRATAAGGE